MKSGLVVLSLAVFSPLWLPYGSLVPTESGNRNWDSYVGQAGSTYDAQANPAQANGTVRYNPLAPLASVSPTSPSGSGMAPNR